METINELAPAQIALDTFFESTRSGMKLPLALRVAARDVLQGTFEAGSKEEALAIGATLLWAAIEESEADGIRPLHEAILFRWMDDVTTKTGPGLTGAAPPQEKGGAVDNPRKADNTVYNTADNNLMQGDKETMGLTGEQITALALSIETGQVQTPEDVVGVPFGTDPKLTDTAKARRKAGMDSLSQLLSAKDASGILKHLTDLIRDLTEADLGRQAALVTAFLMEMQQLFRNDQAAMLEYLRLYLRRYKGRAFPVKLDFSLYAQSVSTNMGKAVLTEDQKSAIKVGQQSAAKIESLTSKLNSLTQSISEMKKLKGDGGKGSGSKTCNYCGKTGHFEASCKLNPKSSSYDADFAKKVKAKEEEDE
jgi:methyl-accepting chemotaxis protein